MQRPASANAGRAASEAPRPRPQSAQSVREQRPAAGQASSAAGQQSVAAHLQRAASASALRTAPDGAVTGSRAVPPWHHAYHSQSSGAHWAAPRANKLHPAVVEQQHRTRFEQQLFKMQQLYGTTQQQQQQHTQASQRRAQRRAQQQLQQQLLQQLAHERQQHEQRQHERLHATRNSLTVAAEEVAESQRRERLQEHHERQAAERQAPPGRLLGKNLSARKPSPMTSSIRGHRHVGRSGDAVYLYGDSKLEAPLRVKVRGGAVFAAAAPPMATTRHRRYQRAWEYRPEEEEPQLPGEYQQRPQHAPQHAPQQHASPDQLQHEDGRGVILGVNEEMQHRNHGTRMDDILSQVTVV